MPALFIPYGPWPCCSCCRPHEPGFAGHRLPCTEVQEHTLAQVADALASLPDDGVKRSFSVDVDYAAHLRSAMLWEENPRTHDHVIVADHVHVKWDGRWWGNVVVAGKDSISILYGEFTDSLDVTEA